MYPFLSTFWLAVFATCFVIYAAKSVISNWNYCSSPDALIVTLWGVSVSTCAEECDKRPTCLLYNYRKKSTSCTLLSREGQLSATDKECVSGASSKNATQCTCSAGEVCDKSDGTCHIRECRPYMSQDGTVYGNGLSRGSKVKVVYESDMKSCILECRERGLWVLSKPCTVTKCPANSNDFKMIGNQKLKICWKGTPQPVAAEACRPYGELVRITTFKQYEAIRDTLIEEGKDIGYWVQGKYAGYDRQWKFNDGTPLNEQELESAWTDMNGDELCVRLKPPSYIWDDRPCHFLKGYICMAQ